MMPTPDGVARGRSLNRLAFTDAWDTSELPKLRGVPWNLVDRQLRLSKSWAAESDARSINLEDVPRNVWVTRVPDVGEAYASATSSS